MLGLGACAMPLPCRLATTGYRLVFAESDLLPGLIVDRYDDWLSVQFLTLGVDVRRKLLTDLLHGPVQARGHRRPLGPGRAAAGGLALPAAV